MNKVALNSAFLLVSSISFVRANDAQNAHDIAMATNIAGALNNACQSEEFVEWQVDAVKHVQKGVAVLAQQAQQYLSTEEKVIARKILLACSNLCEGYIEYYSAVRLVAKSKQEADKVYEIYEKKLEKKWEALRNAMAIFAKVPFDQSEQLACPIVMQIYAFAQRLFTGLSVALPVVVDELA